jgi:RNA polymerase sigma-70 factor (ECF subfamily)
VVHGVLVAHAPWREVGDLLQDVFVLALRSIDTLEDPTRLGPWILTIARNRVRDHHKSRSNAVQVQADLEPPARDEPLDVQDAEAEEAELVLATIRALPESYRETLILRLVQGLSGPEIAARTGLTHGSVRVNLFRGMKLLRERLERGERRRTP